MCGCLQSIGVNAKLTKVKVFWHITVCQVVNSCGRFGEHRTCILRDMQSESMVLRVWVPNYLLSLKVWWSGYVLWIPGTFHRPSTTLSHACYMNRTFRRFIVKLVVTTIHCLLKHTVTVVRVCRIYLNTFSHCVHLTLPWCTKRSLHTGCSFWSWK
jgi:hypothetical protein